MKKIFRFFWNCGRMGELEGTFVSTQDEIDAAIGKYVYFGEVLGKHSEIYGNISIDDFTLVTDDQDFIEKAIEYKLVPTGYNPLIFMEEE